MNSLINSKSTFLNPNHVVIERDNEISFYSYDTFVACYNKKEDKLYLNSYVWDYSNTTRKYFKTFIDSFTSFSYKTKQNFVKLIDISEDIIILERAA